MKQVGALMIGLLICLGSIRAQTQDDCRSKTFNRSVERIDSLGHIITSLQGNLLQMEPGDRKRKGVQRRYLKAQKVYKKAARTEIASSQYVVELMYWYDMRDYITRDTNSYGFLKEEVEKNPIFLRFVNLAEREMFFRMVAADTVWTLDPNGRWYGEVVEPDKPYTAQLRQPVATYSLVGIWWILRTIAQHHHPAPSHFKNPFSFEERQVMSDMLNQCWITRQLRNSPDSVFKFINGVLLNQQE